MLENIPSVANEDNKMPLFGKAEIINVTFLMQLVKALHSNGFLARFYQE